MADTMVVASIVELRWKQASKQATLQIRKERDLNTDDPLMIQTSNGEAFVQIYVKVA
jgi:hypothetical protein